VSKVFGSAHLFFFPTKGENYGHVIAEALEAGCPVLISDQTPWSDVGDFDAGWSFSLDNKEGFLDAIKELYKMDNVSFQKKSQSSKAFANLKINKPTTIQKYKEIFSS
jgi:glycosyltransferase involved in cell wall biosynthesis